MPDEERNEDDEEEEDQDEDEDLKRNVIVIIKNEGVMFEKVMFWEKHRLMPIR